MCPVVALTADNKETTCKDKGIEEGSEQCVQDLAYKTAIMTIAEETSGLGTKSGGVFNCGQGAVSVEDKVCKHDMVWKKIPYIVDIVNQKFKQWKLV